MARHNIKQRKEDPITVIIPAAGEGRRMKSYGPKSLIRLTKESVLERQIRIITKIIDNVNFIVVTGFECDKLMESCPDYFIKLENENYKITNVSRSISIALRAVKAERVLIIYGDLVFNERALSKMDYSASCTSARNDEFRQSEVGCIIDADGYITITKRGEPRAGFIATGTRGKIHCEQLRKTLDCGILQLDQKVYSDTQRSQHRLQFYSKADISKLLKGLLPFLEMKKTQAKAVLAFIEEKDSMKKEELKKVVRYYNWSDDTKKSTALLSEWGVQADDVTKWAEAI